MKTHALLYDDSGLKEVNDPRLLNVSKCHLLLGFGSTGLLGSGNFTRPSSEFQVVQIARSSTTSEIYGFIKSGIDKLIYADSGSAQDSLTGENDVLPELAILISSAKCRGGKHTMTITTFDER